MTSSPVISRIRNILAFTIGDKLVKLASYMDRWTEVNGEIDGIDGLNRWIVTWTEVNGELRE